MVGGKTLADHYRIIFALAQHHKWSVSDMEEMLPYELEIYTLMLQDHIREMEEQQRQNKF
jgi:hypothetical protein